MTTPDDPHAEIVTRACAGDVRAIETLVEAVQNGIYTLAVRMLWSPEDAQDATQEILVRIITHLSSFRGESRFTSWCYAVAVNYLRSARRSRVEAAEYTFESFETELHETAVAAPETMSGAEYDVAIEEIKVGCTLGMLQCLDREHRLAYILGEIMELDHNEASFITGSTAAAFRQRLARARKAIIEFTSRVCGIVDGRNACSCKSRLPYALQTGRVQRGRPAFGEGLRVTAAQFGAIQQEVRRLEQLRRAAALYRAHPVLVAPNSVRDALRDLLGASGEWPPA
jgi:RNA polymerase sigma factor (sigma-70 family)